MGKVLKPFQHLDIPLEQMLAGIQPDQSYCPASIASLFFKLDEDANRFHRLRRFLTSIGRRHGFPKQGDTGEVSPQGLPTWGGARWIEALNEEQNPKKVVSRPKKSQTKTRVRAAGPGRRMVYGKLIRSVEPFELFDPAKVVQCGLEDGFFRGIGKGQLEAKQQLAINACDQFRRRYLPKTRDGYLDGQANNNRVKAAWYGWRWLLALPDYEVDPEQKESLRQSLRDRGCNFEDETITPRSVLAVVDASPSPVEFPAVAIGKPAVVQDETVVAAVSIETADPVVPVARRILRWPRRRSLKGLALIAGLIAVGSVSAWVVPSFQQGYDVLKSEGPAAAYWFFRDANQNAKKRDVAQEYGLAWAAYRNQFMEEAEAIAANLLQSDEDEGWSGNVYYLQGHIAMSKQAFDQAFEFFDKALRFYQEYEQDDNAHNALLGLARWAFATDNLVQAELFLEQASHHLSPKLNMGAYHHLNSYLAFKMGDYENAYLHSIKGIGAFGDDQNRKAQALSDAGFYLMLLGDFQSGKKYTMEAQWLTVKTGDLKQYHYSLLNEIFFSRCHSLEIDSAVTKVRAWIKENDDFSLKKYLEFVLASPCNMAREKRVGAGDPSAPSGPPPKIKKTQ